MLIDLEELQKEFALVDGKMPPKAFLVLLVVLALLSLAIYGSSLRYPFNGWDDYAFYVDDPVTHALTLANLKTIFTEPRLSVWYPLARLSHAVDFYFFGAQAMPSRIINVVLHIANSYLVFLIGLLCLRHSNLAKDDTGCFIAAALAGILFCIHPQHVEVVVWISQRKELLSAFFFFSAVYLYLHYCLEPSRAVFLAGTILCGTLAMLAKPIAVTLFPALLLIECLHTTLAHGRYRWRVIVMAGLRLSPLLAIGLTVGLLTIHTHNRVDSLMLDHYYSLPFRIELSLYNTARLLLCMLFPLHLSPAMDIPAFITGGGIVTRVAIVTLMLLLVAFIKGNRISKAWLYCLAIFFIVHLPVSGILMFGTYASGDRYAYVPTMLFYVAFAFLVLPLTRQLNRPLFLGLAIMLVVGLSTRAAWQTHIWKSDFTLWDHVVHDYPRNAMSLYYLGEEYRQAHHYPEAIHYMEEAIALGPVFRGYPPYIGVADVVELYKKTGDFPQAIKAYQRLLHYYGENAKIYAAMGVLSIAIGQIPEATTYLDKAFSLDPTIVNELQKQLPYFSGDAQQVLGDWLQRRQGADPRK